MNADLSFIEAILGLAGVVPLPQVQDLDGNRDSFQFRYEGATYEMLMADDRTWYFKLNDDTIVAAESFSEIVQQVALHIFRGRLEIIADNLEQNMDLPV